MLQIVPSVHTNNTKLQLHPLAYMRFVHAHKKLTKLQIVILSKRFIARSVFSNTINALTLELVYPTRVKILREIPRMRQKVVKKKT